jgi:hypothetical protein
MKIIYSILMLLNYSISFSEFKGLLNEKEFEIKYQSNEVSVIYDKIPIETIIYSFSKTYNLFLHYTPIGKPAGKMIHIEIDESAVDWLGTREELTTQMKTFVQCLWGGSIDDDIIASYVLYPKSFTEKELDQHCKSETVKPGANIPVTAKEAQRPELKQDIISQVQQARDARRKFKTQILNN